MNKNKGFTLIELLAVIVLLAILMVVAVPKILNVIENSRKSAAESSIKLVKDAIRSQVTSESMMGTNFTSDESGCYTFNFDDQTSGNIKELQLKNKENITGTIKYCNGNFTNNTLVFDGQDMGLIVCKGAKKETLHTEECKWTDNTYYCSGAGYTSSGKYKTTTITYGTVPDKELKSGDAFDCDVNGDGTYDSKIERFYYVSDYYNTNTKKEENDTAVLIYYNNISSGKPSNSTTYAYDASKENFHGPRKAIEQLPSTSEWRNVSLKNSTRAILNENGGNTTNGGPLPSNFSYAGYSAKLLTTQEINKACNITVGTATLGELDKCNYLMENTKYSNTSIGNYGYWLENARSDYSTIVWLVSGRRRYVGSDTANNDGDFGVRPAIEVTKSNIEY
mgnify:CR=1 FL=1